jgi:hypothetical protein
MRGRRHNINIICLKFFLLTVEIKDRVRKIRDRNAIGSNYSFGPYLILRSFLLLFSLLTEIERGRVRKIRGQKALPSHISLVLTFFRCFSFCFSFC